MYHIESTTVGSWGVEGPSVPVLIDVAGVRKEDGTISDE